jgi:ABC-type branched-subunit amino acid transport system substrate-binding protein
LYDAISKVGTNPEAIKSYLESVKDRRGAAGVLTFDGNGDPLSGHVLKQVIGGELAGITVEPVKK